MTLRRLPVTCNGFIVKTTLIINHEFRAKGQPPPRQSAHVYKVAIMEEREGGGGVGGEGRWGGRRGKVGWEEREGGVGGEGRWGGRRGKVGWEEREGGVGGEGRWGGRRGKLVWEE